MALAPVNSIACAVATWVSEETITSSPFFNPIAK